MASFIWKMRRRSVHVKYFVLMVVSLIGLTCVMLIWKRGWPCFTCLAGLRSPWVDSGSTPVYVVEEHHEVLLYWYEAVERGLIRPQGNVLLHIDGHSDAAPPDRRDILPVNRRLKLNDIYNMMQKNDVFIAAAGLSGLIKRYIWIRPPFKVAEPVVADHHVININIGVVNRFNIDGGMTEDICACVKTYPEGLITPPGETCGMINLKMKSLDDSGFIVIDSNRCTIEIEDVLMEIVSEVKAIELMKSGHWITSLDSVILDIDEDYYGCEPAVQPLYDVNVTEKMLMWVQYYISLLFCPTEARDELEADRFYARLVDKVIDQQRFKHGDQLTMRQYLSNATADLFADIQVRRLRPALCSSDKTARKHISRLLKYFLFFTPDKLEIFKEIGICFRQSPRTLTFDPKEGMSTCDGYNRPNDTLVPFHTPSPEEVTFRTSQLKVMLGSDGLHPGVVTVCRSMRDGYTPRKFFHRIEEDVLGVLKDVFKTVDDTSIFYDPYLLGGVSGWPGRHEREE